MSSFIANSQAYNIQAETEVSTILSNFSTEYIYGVITDILQQRHTTFEATSKPNLIISYEDIFKTLLVQYPSDKDNIIYVRDETYKEIIDIISKEFGLEVKYDETVDLFILAKFIYDFFISNYNIYISSFFSNIIIKEKDGIYQALSLDADKKSKDTSTIYSKKTYSDPKIGLINAQLTKVIGYMSQMDITMETILNYVYGNNIIITNLFTQHVFPNTSLYQSAYCALLGNPHIYPLIITSIRLEIQRICSPNKTGSMQL